MAIRRRPTSKASRELIAFLDLVAELIAAAVWQGTSGSTAANESLAAQPDGHGASPASEAARRYGRLDGSSTGRRSQRTSPKQSTHLTFLVDIV